MTRAEEIYKKLIIDFGFKYSRGRISFTLKDISIIVGQNNVVGRNILEEWIDKWMTEGGIDHKHNMGQSSPDFWLNTSNMNEDWLEVKSFYWKPEIRHIRL